VILTNQFHGGRLIVMTDAYSALMVAVTVATVALGALSVISIMILYRIGRIVEKYRLYRNAVRIAVNMLALAGFVEMWIAIKVLEERLLDPATAFYLVLVVDGLFNIVVSVAGAGLLIVLSVSRLARIVKKCRCEDGTIEARNS